MGYQVLAQLPDCEGGDCPKILRDPETGMIGVQGTVVPGATEEHISWMSPEDYRILVGQLPL